MAKKKDEKDVLVVRDEKTGEISVVAGLNADGSPKRIPAKAENAQSFLQFDRHGDVLDNFFRNFFRQCREPMEKPRDFAPFGQTGFAHLWLQYD